MLKVNSTRLLFMMSNKLFATDFSHIQETQNSKKCLSESENCPHPIFFQKVVMKGSEVQ